MAMIYAGNMVTVITADGRRLQRRAFSGVVQGDDFPVVWVAREAEWQAAKAQVRTPQGLPWPAEDVEIP